MTREGDIDRLCTPRFDSDAQFTSLLGEDRHGHWSLRIADGQLAAFARIELDLRTEDAPLLRYRTRGRDGLPGDEHPFLVCGFLLVQQYAAAG